MKFCLSMLLNFKVITWWKVKVTGPDFRIIHHCNRPIKPLLLWLLLVDGHGRRWRVMPAYKYCCMPRRLLRTDLVLIDARRPTFVRLLHATAKCFARFSHSLPRRLCVSLVCLSVTLCDLKRCKLGSRNLHRELPQKL